MNGLEAARKIKASPEWVDTRIVAVTAHALEEERIEILAAGCDDFIRKPFRDTEIYESLAKHLNIRFAYADEPVPLSLNPEEDLDMAQLEDIPTEFLECLTDAVVLLDEALCLKVAGTIGDHNPGLGNRLQHMVKNLQYKEILAALDKLAGTETPVDSFAVG